MYGFMGLVMQLRCIPCCRGYRVGVRKAVNREIGLRYQTLNPSVNRETKRNLYRGFLEEVTLLLIEPLRKQKGLSPTFTFDLSQ